MARGLPWPVAGRIGAVAAAYAIEVRGCQEHRLHACRSSSPGTGLRSGARTRSARPCAERGLPWVEAGDAGYAPGREISGRPARFRRSTSAARAACPSRAFVTAGASPRTASARGASLQAQNRSLGPEALPSPQHRCFPRVPPSPPTASARGASLQAQNRSPSPEALPSSPHRCFPNAPAASRDPQAPRVPCNHAGDARRCHTCRSETGQEPRATGRTLAGAHAHDSSTEFPTLPGGTVSADGRGAPRAPGGAQARCTRGAFLIRSHRPTPAGTTGISAFKSSSVKTMPAPRKKSRPASTRLSSWL